MISNVKIREVGAHAESVTTAPWAAIYVIAMRRNQPTKIYNVSNICMDATLTLVEDGVSSFSFQLANSTWDQLKIHM